MLIPIMLALAAAGAPNTSDESENATVVAAENGWEAAEVTGNRQFLDALLDDSYVSVSANGKALSKADIIAGAVRHATEHPGMQPDEMDASSTVWIDGDLALVRHHGKTSVSVDVLHRREGRWIAVYSQHTELPAVTAA